MKPILALIFCLLTQPLTLHGAASRQTSINGQLNFLLASRQYQSLTQLAKSLYYNSDTSDFASQTLTNRWLQAHTSDQNPILLHLKTSFIAHSILHGHELDEATGMKALEELLKILLLFYVDTQLYLASLQDVPCADSLPFEIVGELNDCFKELKQNLVEKWIIIRKTLPADPTESRFQRALATIQREWLSPEYYTESLPEWLKKHNPAWILFTGTRSKHTGEVPTELPTQSSIFNDTPWAMYPTIKTQPLDKRCAQYSILQQEAITFFSNFADAPTFFSRCHVLDSVLVESPSKRAGFATHPSERALASGSWQTVAIDAPIPEAEAEDWEVVKVP